MNCFGVLAFAVCLHTALGATLFQNYNDIPDFIAEKVDGRTRTILMRFGRVSGIQTMVQTDDDNQHIVNMVTNGIALAKTESTAAVLNNAEKMEECYISADEETVEEFLYVFDAKFRTIDSKGITFLMEIPGSSTGSEVSELRSIESSSDSQSGSASDASESITAFTGTSKPTTAAWDEWNLRHGIDNQIPHYLQTNFDKLLDIIDRCMTTESNWKKVHTKLTIPGIEQELEPINEPNRDRARRAPGIYPGTVWCGLGDVASSLEDIGEHADTDICCREHDFCSNFIPAFSLKFGYLNPRPYTVNHCDCDLRLRECLREANTTVAMSVAHLFFNVLEPVCFVLEEYETCTFLTWWGRCYEYGIAQRAIIKENEPWY